MAWNIRGLENPSSDEFLENPDLRQIAAFFLGWVFFYSVQIILSSPLLREHFTRACSSLHSLITKHTKIQHEPDDIEAHSHTLPTITHPPGEKSPKFNTEFNNSTNASRLTVHEGNALLVTLALCFTCASVAHFASLLQYTSAGEGACAFVVAWGGSAAQVGRLTGLLILSLELKKLVSRREIYVFWVALFTLLGFVIANNAIAIGTLRSVPQLGISLCYRRHFTPTGLTSSLALIFVESYLMVRFICFISPKAFGWFSKLDTLGDSRVYRTLSLLLLDVLTITSAAKPTNLLVDFVPFAIGGVIVLFAFGLTLEKTEEEAAPSVWSHGDETRRFALHPTPAPSMVSTLSIRRMSNRTVHTVSLPSPGFSDDDPPPAPTRSALSLRVALRHFTTQEQQNSRAVLDGRINAKAESPTLPHPATAQSPRSRHSSIRRFFTKRSEHSETRSIRLSPRKGHRPPVELVVINPDEPVPHVPQLREISIPPDLGVSTSDFLQMPRPRKRSNRTKSSSTSSGLTYMTPDSKNISSRRPSYLLSPSRSYLQSTPSTPHTPIPTWEEMYRQQGLQSGSWPELPPLPSRRGSIIRQSASPHTSTVPYVPFIMSPPVSPPPGLTKFRPITQPSLLANTQPVERASGIKGPRPLVTTSRSRGRTLRDGSQLLVGDATVDPA